MTLDYWHLTPDTGHMTHDTWHLTYDTWHVAHGGGWTFSQNFSSPALMVWDWQCPENISTNHDWLSDRGDCRTAPATPGLLKRLFHFCLVQKRIYCFLLFRPCLGNCKQFPVTPNSPGNVRGNILDRTKSGNVTVSFSQTFRHTVHKVWIGYQLAKTGICMKLGPN